jgi:hypothetical protein
LLQKHPSGRLVRSRRPLDSQRTRTHMMNAVVAAGRAARARCHHAQLEETTMPLFMDEHHHVDGLTAEAVAGAHQKDLEVQARHGVKYLRYWYNEAAGKVYCLVDAPTKEAAEAVHREAHGLVADEIVEVSEGS